MAGPAISCRARFFVPSPTRPCALRALPSPPGGFLSARTSPIDHIK